MTEAKIFEILLQEQHDFPKLHSEAASTIATSFTDIIYDTLKLKSSLPTSRRLNILKVLKTLSSGCDTHVRANETNYHKFIEACQQSDDFQEFVNNVNNELEVQMPGDLYTEIQRFYNKKNERHQQNNKKRELVKNHDQEVLNEANFSGRIQRNISYYETNKNIIQKLICSDPVFFKENNSVDITDMKYREKQIKFAYGLLYLQEWVPLRKVLDRLVKYNSLCKYETNFLKYLYKTAPLAIQDLRQFIIKNFPFIYEKIIIKLGTTIIQLREGDIFDYFGTLLLNKEIIMIKEMCHDESFRMKLKHILYELYTHSFCNPTMLKFLEFLCNL